MRGAGTTPDAYSFIGNAGIEAEGGGCCCTQLRGELKHAVGDTACGSRRCAANASSCLASAADSEVGLVLSMVEDGKTWRHGGNTGGELSVLDRWPSVAFTRAWGAEARGGLAGGRGKEEAAKGAGQAWSCAIEVVSLGVGVVLRQQCLMLLG